MRVDFLNSGWPARPPISLRSALISSSRERVVFVVMIPSMFKVFATCAISVSSPTLKSGAIFKKIAMRFGRVSRTSITLVSKVDRAVLPCKSRRFSVLGEETLTVAKSTYAPHVVSTEAKSAARSVLVLFAPRLRPTIPALGRTARRLAMTSAPSLLKPKRLIEAWSSRKRNKRGLSFPG